MSDKTLTVPYLPEDPVYVIWHGSFKPEVIKATVRYMVIDETSITYTVEDENGYNIDVSAEDMFDTHAKARSKLQEYLQQYNAKRVEELHKRIEDFESRLEAARVELQEAEKSCKGN